MYILERDDNPIYCAKGETLKELMEAVGADVDIADGVEAHLEAIWPTDPADVDEDFDIPTPVEINEQTLKELASRAWDTTPANLSLMEYTQPYSAGHLRAIMDFLGLDDRETAQLLHTSADTVKAWTYGHGLIPVRVAVKMNELVQAHNDQVQSLANALRQAIYPLNHQEQQLTTSLSWEKRVIQRLAAEHGIIVEYADGRGDPRPL